jgi:hypothetical protein
MWFRNAEMRDALLLSSFENVLTKISLASILSSLIASSGDIRKSPIVAAIQLTDTIQHHLSASICEDEALGCDLPAKPRACYHIKVVGRQQPFALHFKGKSPHNFLDE